MAQKETSLVNWEATLRDREESIKGITDKIKAEKAAFQKEQLEFKQWRTNELSRLESQNTKLNADLKGLELSKEEFTKSKKEQEIIRSKLVSERAALDTAWNEINYNKLKAQ